MLSGTLCRSAARFIAVTTTSSSFSLLAGPLVPPAGGACALTRVAGRAAIPSASTIDGRSTDRSFDISSPRFSWPRTCLPQHWRGRAPDAGSDSQERTVDRSRCAATRTYRSGRLRLLPKDQLLLQSEAVGASGYLLPQGNMSTAPRAPPAGSRRCTAGSSLPAGEAKKPPVARPTPGPAPPPPPSPRQLTTRGAMAT